MVPLCRRRRCRRNPTYGQEKPGCGIRLFYQFGDELPCPDDSLLLLEHDVSEPPPEARRG